MITGLHPHPSALPAEIDHDVEQLVLNGALPLPDEAWARFRSYWESWCKAREDASRQEFLESQAAHPGAFVTPGPSPMRPTPYTHWLAEQQIERAERRLEAAELDNKTLYAASTRPSLAPRAAPDQLPRFTPLAALLLGLALGSLFTWLELTMR